MDCVHNSLDRESGIGANISRHISSDALYHFIGNDRQGCCIYWCALSLPSYWL